MYLHPQLCICSSKWLDVSPHYSDSTVESPTLNFTHQPLHISGYKTRMRCTLQAEYMDPDLLAFGVDMTHELDRRFGLPPKVTMSQVGGGCSFSVMDSIFLFNEHVLNIEIYCSRIRRSNEL